MAGPHRNADLAVGLEPADPRPMPGTRVDHDERPLLLIDDDAGGGVMRTSPVVFAGRDSWRPSTTSSHSKWSTCGACPAMCSWYWIVALAQDVEEQDAALPRVHGVVEAIVVQVPCSLRLAVACSVFVMIFRASRAVRPMW